jgi:ABC-2 type transport system permease protein
MNSAAGAIRNAGPHPEYPLWHYVWKLLRLQIVSTVSGFRNARLRRKIGTIIVAVLILLFAAFAFVLSWLLLAFLRSPELATILAEQNMGSPASFLESVPVLLLAMTFLAILLTSFGVLLQALYLAGDMDFLLSAPVPARAVFVSKQLQAILPNFGLIALFSLPVLFGLGVASGYNLLYYPFVVIVLVMLALAAAGVSSLLVMGIVRIFPARRVAEVLGFVGATISIICSQSSNLIRLSNPDWENLSGQQVPLDLVTRFNTPWSPLAWAGHGLVDLGEGRWLTAILFLALTLALAGGLFLLALTTAERLYYSGWASMQVGGRKKKAARALPAATVRTKSAPSPLARVLPQTVLAVLGKDFLVMRRDLRNMSQLVTPMIFGILYGIIILRPGGLANELPSDTPAWFIPILKNATLYSNVGISLFVSWSLLSRLALMSFSQEGKNYWMIKIAPVGTGRLILAKYLSAYLPALVIGWIFLLIISLIQSAGLSVLVFGLIVVALSLAGTAGINLAFGITGANLTWEDPRKMNAGLQGCLSMLLGFGYVAVSLVLFFGPPLILSGFGLPDVLGQAAGLILGGAVSLACAILPPFLVADRVARIGEA